MENERLIKLIENTKFDAHKGSSWKYPENSHGAIVSALLDPDVDAVEFDVKMTKDGKLVIRHDENMFTTSNSLKTVYNSTLEELRQLKMIAHRVDYWIHYFQIYSEKNEEYGRRQIELLKKLKNKTNRIMTLDELLDLAPKDKKLLLEVKGSDEFYKTDKFSKGILELVNAYSYKNIYVHGANPKLMMWFLNNVKNAKVGIGLSKDLSPLELPFYHACFALSHMKQQLPEIIAALEKRPNREFHFWKVDTTREFYLYKMFLEKVVEHGLESQTSVMTNDVPAAKMLFKQQINNLRK